MKGKLFKRVTALLSTAAMLLTYADFSAIDFSVHAEGNGGETPQLADFDLNGNGIIDDGEKDWGYELVSADDLYWFAGKVNNEDASINAFLAEDITVNENLLTDLITVDEDGTATVNDNKEVKEWNYISTYRGTFDGAGHTISGLYYNTNRSHIGFVGDNHGTIKNLGIINSYFGGIEDVGTICGYMTSAGIIENCYSSGGIVKGVSSSGSLYTGYMGPMTGGVCGSTYGTIRGCYNYSKVIDIAYGGGGICGFAQGIIENCTNYGEVICNSNFLDGTQYEGSIYAGGICAYTEKEIINCSNFGNVTSKGISGGVAGCVAYIETECIVSKSFNKGKVTGYGEAGGICGTSFAGEIIDCYNTGDVNATGEYASIGGICGSNWSSVKNCFNTGSLPEKTAKNYVGGICGDGYEVENCYCLNTTAENGVGTGKSGSAEAMTAQQFASGEVCWLLNVEQSDNPVFYQNIGKDISPVLDSTHHAVKHSETSYYNEHSYENGICTVCDGYEPADAVKDVTDIDSDGNKEETVYEISNAGQLYWFADKVHNDNEHYGSANAFLAEDITVNENLLTDLITVDEDGTATLKNEENKPRVWTPIGDYSFQYSGIFNGNNKTISGLYFNKSDADYVGLFGCVDSGTIKNVTIADSYMYGKTKVGGICGYNSSGSIENCYNTGDVSGSNLVGGVCGCNSKGTITNCYNTGNDVSGNMCVGGVCGSNTGTITDCSNTGDVSGDSKVGGVCGDNLQGEISKCYNTGNVSGGNYVGGVCGSNIGTISNCYNTGAVEGTSSVGGVCGDNPGTISNCYYLKTEDLNADLGGILGADVAGSAEAKSAEQFASGEVCWLLNVGQSDNPVFYQNIGKDASPVLDSTHHAVKHSETSYYNEHTDFDEEGFCKVCGNGYQPATTVKDVNDIDGDGHTDDDVYEISNAGQLYWFAGLVNGTLGGVERIRSANAVLTADITVNSGVLDENGELNSDTSNFRVWTPIGYYDYVNKKSYSYYGAFDGAGHTISGLYFNDSSANNVGLFGFVSNGESKNKIMNLTVSDSYFCGKEKVGGVCGYSYHVPIQNCSNTGTVRGASYVGGVCGYISERVIENCYNTGKVTATGEDSFVGGICGYNCDKNTIQNCYNTGAVSGDTIVGGICGRASYYGQPTIMIKNCYNKGAVSGNTYVGSICGAGDRVTIEKCYYLKTEGVRGRGTGDDKAGSTEVKSGEQFASGEVCWLLNGGETQAETRVFFQNIDKEAFPVLDSKHHTVVEKDGAYSNEHNFESEICTICGAFEDGMGAKLAGHSLTLDGSIGVNFYMELDKSVAEDENAYMHFTLPNGKTENVNVSQAEKKNVNGMNCYVFKCNVAAKEMTATIKAQMFSNGKQGTVYDYTVKEYADYLFANAYEDDGTTVKNQEYAKAYALVEAMVNYGAYSQIYFDYNTEFLANAGRTDNVSTVTAENVNKPYDKTKNNLPDCASLVSANLELESETVLNLLFTNTTGKELTFKTSDDVTLTQTMTADGIKVTITNIAAQHLSEDIIVNISVDGDTASYSAMYSPMNYCYSVLSKETTETRTDELKNVMRAFWLYNAAAASYFAR